VSIRPSLRVTEMLASITPGTVSAALCVIIRNV
jgi:hypothetical protein